MAKAEIRAGDYDPLRPDVRVDPYPYYAALRRETRVHQVTPGVPFYCVARYDDVLFVVSHPETYSSDALRGPSRDRTVSLFPNSDALADQRLFESAWLLGVDPPDHGRLRRLVSRGFTPRRIAGLEPRMREIVSRCVGAVIDVGEMDLQRDLAVPFPVTVIAQLLGVEAERIEQFKHWSDAVAVGLSGFSQEWSLGQIRDAFEEMADYIERMMAERRLRPRDDLITTLMQAEEGDVLSTSEVLAFVTLLLVAGNETTTNLIGNAMKALLRHPDQLAEVAREPALIPAMLEETLRWESPVQGLARTVVRDTQLCGTKLPKGALLMVLFASANRDERQFPDPDRFDVHRNPQGHLAFGQGIHFCLGASLARLEARVAFEVLLERCRSFELADEDVPFVESFFVRGPSRLRIRFETA